MIKLLECINESFCEDNPLGARILSNFNSYGVEYQFCMCWQQIDNNNKMLSLILKLDDSITVHSIENLECEAIEELKEFINVVGCSNVLLPLELAEKMYDKNDILEKSVMKFDTVLDCSNKKSLKEVDLFDLYELISVCHKIEATKESRDFFVTDISHKIRHGQADVYAVENEGRYVSCALALAITKTDVLLGGVSTYIEHRKKGYAKTCIYELIKKYQDKNMFILCKEDKIKFYEKLGFKKIGNVAEVSF